MARGHFNRMVMRLAGVRLVGDIYERACERGLSLPIDGKRRRRLRLVKRARTLFIHIPKNAGTSVSHALYGEQIKHASIRYYARMAPRLLWRTPSFAVLRDPLTRFVSAYAYALAGGAADKPVAAPFRERYMGFASIDAALDHIEQAEDLYQIDHIFRPQSWYVTDRSGKVIVDRLFLLEEFDRVRRFLALRDVDSVPHLNHVEKAPVELSAAQIARIRAFYARDFELVEALRDEASENLRVLSELPLPMVEEERRLAG